MTSSVILSICVCVLYAGVTGRSSYYGTMSSIIILILNHIDLQSSKLQKLEVASGRRGVSSCSLLSRSMAFVLLCSSFPDLNPPAAEDSLGSKSSWLEPPIRDHKSEDIFSTVERKSNPPLTAEDAAARWMALNHIPSM